MEKVKKNVVNIDKQLNKYKCVGSFYFALLKRESESGLASIKGTRLSIWVSSTQTVVATCRPCYETNFLTNLWNKLVQNKSSYGLWLDRAREAGSPFRRLLACGEPLKNLQQNVDIKSTENQKLVLLRQGPRLSIRIVIWILPSDTDTDTDTLFGVHKYFSSFQLAYFKEWDGKLSMSNHHWALH